MLQLTITKRTDPRLLQRMAKHYSQPKGFVGRNICYAIEWADEYYGHIVGGSATRFLPGRNQFLGVLQPADLNKIVNNLFYNISPLLTKKYPQRNFTSLVLDNFCEQIRKDWELQYGEVVLGFETLIEKPRTGELYRRAGWIELGETIGYTCKRDGGKGTDSWSGKRVWETKNLRPKLVLAKRVTWPL